MLRRVLAMLAFAIGAMAGALLIRLVTMGAATSLSLAIIVGSGVGAHIVSKDPAGWTAPRWGEAHLHHGVRGARTAVVDLGHFESLVPDSDTDRRISSRIRTNGSLARPTEVPGNNPLLKPESWLRAPFAMQKVEGSNPFSRLTEIPL
jgi:hypothetical protein